MIRSRCIIHFRHAQAAKASDDVRQAVADGGGGVLVLRRQRLDGGHCVSYAIIEAPERDREKRILAALHHLPGIEVQMIQHLDPRDVR